MPVKNYYAPAAVFALAALSHTAGVKNLRRIRNERGLSQAKLAELAVVSQPTISKLENGGMNATLDNIHSIARALNVEPIEVFDRPELQSRALAAIGRIAPEQREAALVVLEAMAGAPPGPKRPGR